MKLLLHTCCAPCLIYPLQRLREEGMQVTGFFYNPNIHPCLEYQKRLAAAEALALAQGMELVIPAYLAQDFFRATGANKSGRQRCMLCWSLRLGSTAEFAAQNSFDAFSTTLLVSPYQDQEALKTIGSAAAKDKGVEFCYRDFRPGFRKAHQEAKAAGIYCQKYCGCLYSQSERG